MVSYAIEEIVAAVDMSEGLLKIEVDRPSRLSAEFVGFAVVVSEDDVVHEGECALEQLGSQQCEVEWSRESR